jgi:hypothetical protein
LKTLILHWNGATWKRVPSPSPSGGAVLFGAAALSAGNAWAVGTIGVSDFSGVLGVHWNGTTWERVTSTP